MTATMLSRLASFSPGVGLPSPALPKLVRQSKDWRPGEAHGRLWCWSSVITLGPGLLFFITCKRQPGMGHSPTCSYFFVCRSKTSGPIFSFGSNTWERAMPAKSSWTPVLKTMDLLISEINQFRSAGPHFRIVHRFRVPGSDCLPGEEIFAAFFVNRGCEYQLRLS